MDGNEIEKNEGSSTDRWEIPYFIGEGEEKELNIFTLLIQIEIK